MCDLTGGTVMRDFKGQIFIPGYQGGKMHIDNFIGITILPHFCKLKINIPETNIFDTILSVGLL